MVLRYALICSFQNLKEVLLNFSTNRVTIGMFLLESDSQLSLQHSEDGSGCLFSEFSRKLNGRVSKCSDFYGHSTPRPS